MDDLAARDICTGTRKWSHHHTESKSDDANGVTSKEVRDIVAKLQQFARDPDHNAKLTWPQEQRVFEASFRTLIVKVQRLYANFRSAKMPGFRAAQSLAVAGVQQLGHRAAIAKGKTKGDNKQVGASASAVRKPTATSLKRVRRVVVKSSKKKNQLPPESVEALLFKWHAQSEFDGDTRDQEFQRASKLMLGK